MAAIRSFVKIKPFATKTSLGSSFNEIRKGINRQGVVVQTIGENLDQVRKLVEFEREFLLTNSDEKIRRAKVEKKEKDTFAKRMKRSQLKSTQRKKRDTAENAAEQGEKEYKNEAKKVSDKVKKPVKGFLGAIGSILGPIVKFFILYGVLDFMEKNPEKIVKLFKLMYTIGKFAFKLTNLGIGMVMDGLTNMFGDFSADGINENKVKRGFRFLFGALQLLGGVAALRVANYVMAPWKLMQDINFVRKIFSNQAEMSAEAEYSQKQRMTGYRDNKSGVIYTKEEVEQMRKSARRADAKRATKAGKGMKSTLYEDELNKRLTGQFEGRRKGPLAKLQQRGRIAKGKIGGGIKNFAKANPGKVAGGLSVVGGITRIAGGLASGERASKAVGAGVGQAAGGLIGAAAGTALLGPFLGPFAPMVGSAIGSFLGEWVGGELGPIMEPIFEPIKRYFGMLWKVISGVFGQLFPPLQEAWNAFADFAKGLFDLIGQVANIIKDFVGFVFGPIFNTIGKVVSFVIEQAKRLMDPGSMLKGYADILTFNLFDFDGYNKKAAGGPVEMAAGGPLLTPVEKKREKILEILKTTTDFGVAGILNKLKMALDGVLVRNAQQQGAAGANTSTTASTTSTSGGTTSGTTGPSSYTGDSQGGRDVPKDPAFLAEVNRIAKKFNINPNDLLGKIASESGFNPRANNGTHVGLIQFSRDSARAVGTSQGALLNMSRAEQMKYAEKYFDYWKLPHGAGAGHLYTVTFLPAFATKPGNYVLAKKGGFRDEWGHHPHSWYSGNAGLDMNNDGQITIDELGERIRRKKREYGIPAMAGGLIEFATGGKYKQEGLDEELKQRHKQVQGKQGARSEDRLAGMDQMAKGGKIFLHWTASGYTWKGRGKYHGIIQGDGSVFQAHDYSQRSGVSHTAYRNGDGVGLSIAALGGPDHNPWTVPIKPIQIESMAKEIANIAKSWGWQPSDINVQNVPTHAEAASGKDGQLHRNRPPMRGAKKNPDNYGPTAWGGDGARWDLWHLTPNGEKGSGGNIIRAKARGYMGGDSTVRKTDASSSSDGAPAGDSGGLSGPGQSTTTAPPVPPKPLTLQEMTDQLFEGVEKGFKEAFKMISEGTEDFDNIRRNYGQPVAKVESTTESGEKKTTTTDAVATATPSTQTATKATTVQEKAKLKAQREKDQRVIPAPLVVTTTQIQPVLNNYGGAEPRVSYTKPSPLLTSNK